ncbi:MAG TPA: hypothetical protein VLC71_05995 [Thermomonas sp.]|nr:hypothetical protein [Thermomonas sp.]
MSKRNHVTIRTRVPKATAETLRAIATAQGMPMARLIEVAVQAVIDVAKKPTEGAVQA